MKTPKVLFVNQEIAPYLPDSELASIGRKLPQGIQELGKEIRTFMPRFGCINERRNQLHEVIRLSGMNLVINEADHPLIIKVASIPSARMQVYFIDNDDFFHRKLTIRDADGTFFPDNDERIIFFARGVLETVKKLRWDPNLVHCNGWFSMILPIFIKKTYCEDPLFKSTKVIVSVYDEAFGDVFCDSFHEKMIFENIDPEEVQRLKGAGYVELMKFAMQYADGVIVSSPTIHPELEAHIKSLTIPVLPYCSPDTYINAYSDFYDKILED